MTAETKQARLLTDKQIEEMMALMKGADTVELKLTVPDSDHRSAVMSLGMDALEAQIRQVFFFDTPELVLSKAGLVVRARRVQGKGGDTVVKLRPVVPAELPDDLRKDPAFGVEVDVMPGGYLCSASLKGKCGRDEPREVALGKRPVRKLFSQAQRALYAEHAPQGIALDDLRVLGPITLLKLRFAPEGLARSMVAEMWLYPDGSRILELSTKCAPGEAFQVGAETRAFLTGHGIDVTGEQQTKTKTALEFFAQLASAQPPRGTNGGQGGGSIPQKVAAAR